MKMKKPGFLGLSSLLFSTLERETKQAKITIFKRDGYIYTTGKNKVG